MGQCAPSSPLNDSQRSIYDEEVSFVTIPVDALGCNVGLPMSNVSRENDDGDDTRECIRKNSWHKKYDKRQSEFLEVHQLDIPQRCIIDQCEIKRVVWLQSDEMLRRQGLLKMHGVSTDEIQIQNTSSFQGFGVSVIENNVDNDQKSILCKPSTASAFTNASNTTIVRTNTIKVSEVKEKIRNVRISSSGINPRTYAGSLLSSPSVSKNAIKEEMGKFNFGNNLKGSSSHKIRPREELLNSNQADDSAQRPIRNHYIQKSPERYQCMSMLRMSMKAKLGWFYTQRYLNVFPNQSKSMIGMTSKNEGGIPDLISESVDGSPSSSCSSDSDHASSTAFGPLPAMTLVECPVTNESLFDLAITGCLGLVPREQHHNPLRSSRRQLRHHYEKISEHCIVLFNKTSRSPLAVCATKETSASPIVQIYYTRQIAIAQKPTTTTQQIGLDWADDLPLYAWAEVHSKGDFPEKMDFTVFTANRFDGSISSQPSYMAFLDGQAIDDSVAIRSPVMRMVGRTDSERRMSGCALIWIQPHEGINSCQGNSSDLSFQINLARGIDPAFLICFTAIVDEILEKSMLVQYKNKITGRKRKDSVSLTKNRLEARSQVSTEKQVTDIPCRLGFRKYTNCKY